MKAEIPKGLEPLEKRIPLKESSREIDSIERLGELHGWLQTKWPTETVQRVAAINEKKRSNPDIAKSKEYREAVSNHMYVRRLILLNLWRTQNDTSLEADKARRSIWSWMQSCYGGNWNSFYSERSGLLGEYASGRSIATTIDSENSRYHRNDETGIYQVYIASKPEDEFRGIDLVVTLETPNTTINQWLMQVKSNREFPVNMMPPEKGKLIWYITNPGVSAQANDVEFDPKDFINPVRGTPNQEFQRVIDKKLDSYVLRPIREVEVDQTAA